MENLRLKFRVWDKYFNRYWTDEEVKNNIQWLLYPDNENIENVIIEQCTGLRDKNGKLIFEGDVVIYEVFVSDWSDEKRKCYGIVYYDDNQHAFGVKTIRQTVTSCFGLNKLISEIEVIGNIHENPDMLKNADNFNTSGGNVKGDNR